jgi:hypothetical protein
MGDQGSAFEFERKPWDVTIHQRVPSGAEELLSPGSQRKVGYERHKSDRDVAIDWPGSSGGRFALASSPRGSAGP